MARHLASGAMTCEQCGSVAETRVVGQRFKNGRCRLRVECDRCGGFSHYLDLGPSVEREIRRLVEDAGQVAEGYP